MTVDLPLTVHKRRGVRGSVLRRSLEEPPSAMSVRGSAISELIRNNSGKQ
jgi:hypothetical protein